MTYREWLTKQNTGEWNIQPERAYNAGYNLAVKYMTTLIEPLKADSYEKGKQAERERLWNGVIIAVERLKTIDTEGLLSDFTDRILEAADNECKLKNLKCPT